MVITLSFTDLSQVSFSSLTMFILAALKSPSDKSFILITSKAVSIAYYVPYGLVTPFLFLSMSHNLLLITGYFR